MMRLNREHSSMCNTGGYTCRYCITKESKAYDYITFKDLEGVEKVSAAYDEWFTGFAFPGGYPILFIDDHANYFCADCAKRVFITENMDITNCLIEEGPPILCDNCNREVFEGFEEYINSDGETDWFAPSDDIPEGFKLRTEW